MVVLRSAVLTFAALAVGVTLGHLVPMFHGTLEEGGNFPISIVSARPVGKVRGDDFNTFEFEFYKNRNDCYDPTLSRDLVNLDSGRIHRAYDRIGRVVQYPLSKPGEQPHRISVDIFIPEVEFPTQRHVIITDFVYYCDGQRLLRSFTTEEFSIHSGGQGY